MQHDAWEGSDGRVFEQHGNGCEPGDVDWGVEVPAEVLKQASDVYANWMGIARSVAEKRSEGLTCERVAKRQRLEGQATTASFVSSSAMPAQGGTALGAGSSAEGGFSA